MGKTRFDFAGQVVAVTGAGKGIGKGAALAFGDAGACVYVIDHTDVTGETTAKAIRDGGGQASFIATSSSTARAASGSTCPWKRRRKTSGTRSSRSISPACSCARRPRSPRSSASRAAASSTWAPWPPSPRCSNRPRPMPRPRPASTRSRGSSRSSSASTGVTVNTLAPGTTASERVVARRTPEQRDAIGKTTLVGRIAEVSDMVGWVLFLAAPESSYLTGQTLAVNGGRLMV